MDVSLRDYLRASMFDGSEGGVHTSPTEHLLDRIVENVLMYLIGDDERAEANLHTYYGWPQSGVPELRTCIHGTRERLARALDCDSCNYYAEPTGGLAGPAQASAEERLARGEAGFPYDGGGERKASPDDASDEISELEAAVLALQTIHNGPADEWSVQVARVVLSLLGRSYDNESEGS